MHEPVTLDDWDVDETRVREARRFWPWWMWPVLLWLPLDAWRERFLREAPGVDPAALGRAGLAPETLAWLAAAFVLVAALAEAGFYGMLWASRGRRLPLLAAAVAVVQAGVLELLALRLLDLAGRPAAPWAAWLAGPRALAPHGAATGAFAAAFGGAGAMALARLALLAGLQANLVRCRWREAFALVCGAWLASHVAQWWLLELFQGRSIFR